MGAVFRAFDYLTQSEVALKSFSINPTNLTFHSQASSRELDVSLAREFRTLAGLRHPNIISVLDYGFDKQPFFTMTLLEDAQTLTEATASLTLLERIELLIQVLQALHYLHRRGILHRDLKPSNIMVVGENQVQVLDFGLAVQHETPQGISGTLAYMAPELLRGVPASVLSDMYAVGVIAYEAITGQPLFKVTDPSLLIMDIMNTVPSVEILPESIRGVIGRLLSKNPTERPHNPIDVIKSFNVGLSKPNSIESIEIRESFLQASRFVGREKELQHLDSALHTMLENKCGASWLIGGESGVGKSRLLDELRIRAMVTGIQVLRGQGKSDNQSSYPLWREPLRHLVLSTELSDLDAAVLKEIVTDIDVILRREIPKAPALEQQSENQRLLFTIGEIFRRQQKPILLILEDLQWAAQSIALLQYLNRLVGELPLLIVGSYRNDERPDLPEQLPEMQLLTLKRINEQAVAQLSESMLGEIGKDAEFVSLLQQETEGNLFFLVEVVRALAEDAGSLENIIRRTLPSHILTGNMETIVRRRLDKVGESYQPLLKLAAIIGRELDFAILEKLAPGGSLDTWLSVCHEAAIFEIEDNRWRFTHDKLRELIVHDILPDDLPDLHRLAAQAIETAYPAQQNKFVESLYYHWKAAGDVIRQLDYLPLFVDMLKVTGATARAQHLLAQGMSSLTELGSAEYADLQLALVLRAGELAFAVSSYEEAIQFFQQAQALAEGLNQYSVLVDSLNGYAQCRIRQGHSDEARIAVKEALKHAEAHDYKKGVTVSLSLMGLFAVQQGDFDKGIEYHQQSLKIRREIGELNAIAVGLSDVGSIAWAKGDLEKAERFLQESLEIFRATGNRSGIANILNDLGLLTLATHQYSSTEAYYLESLSINREIGDLSMIANTLSNLGRLYDTQGNHDRAEPYYEESLQIKRSIGDQRSLAVTLNIMGLAATTGGYFSDAQRYLREAFEIEIAANMRMNLLDAVGIAALLAGKTGNVEYGLQWGSRVLNDEGLSWGSRSVLLPLIEAMGTALSLTDYQTIIERGKSLDFQQVVDDVRAFLNDALSCNPSNNTN